MTYTVYILYSPSKNKFYRGQTNNIEDRLVRHNSKRVLSTKNGAPWTLVWSTVKISRAEAVRFESKLKNLSRSRLIDLMLKYDKDISGPDELNLLIQLSGC